MENKIDRNFTGRFFFGLVLLALGILFLANNFDYIYIDHIGRYWPAILILFGVVRLFEPETDGRHGSGLGWIFLGTWLLVSMNDIWGLSFHNSWPILIIGWGASMIWKATYRKPELKAVVEEDHHGN